MREGKKEQFRGAIEPLRDLLNQRDRAEARRKRAEEALPASHKER